MNKLTPDVSKVRALMRAFGFAIEMRPEPTIVIDGQLSCNGLYTPGTHQIRLRPGYTAAVLAHELCHSQQAGISLPRGYAQGDVAGWRADPLEHEARCVQSAVETGIDSAQVTELMVALNTAGIPLTPEWVRWAARRDITTAKPSRIGRKARLSINQWARAT